MNRTLSSITPHPETVRDLKAFGPKLRNNPLADMEPEQRFASKALAKMFVAEKSIKEKKPFKVSRSNPRRYEVVCVEKSCLFRLNIRAKIDDVFYITKTRHEHTCDILSPTFKKMWIRQRATELLCQREKATASELGDSLRLTFGVHVQTPLLERCMGEAKSGVAFSEQSFGLVRSFLEALETNNPSTTTLFEARDGKFLRAFLMPGMCVHAFHRSTRVVGIDGCHVKSRFGGVILVLTVLDGNGNIFPAAIGFTEGENKETWSWFLSAVRTGLGIVDGGDGIVILSDREKGIKKAVKRLLPHAAHSYCVFHIQKNEKLHYKTALDGLLFKAAKAPTKMVSELLWTR